jgi:hypothetical protein
MSIVNWQYSRSAMGMVSRPNSNKTLYLVINQSGPIINFATMESTSDEEPIDAMQRLLVDGEPQMGARTFDDTIALADFYANTWVKLKHLEVVK